MVWQNNIFFNHKTLLDIATRQTEGNYQNVAKGVISLQQNYNDHLVKALQP